MDTFLTALYRYVKLCGTADGYIVIGALAGTIVFFNIWLIINQTNSSLRVYRVKASIYSAAKLKKRV